MNNGKYLPISDRRHTADRVVLIKEHSRWWKILSTQSRPTFAYWVVITMDEEALNAVSVKLADTRKKARLRTHASLNSVIDVAG
jgi:hypothetical protein